MDALARADRRAAVIEIVQATADAEVAAARRLFEEYAAWLGIDLGFQDFDAELAGLPGDYVPPLGALLLAVDAGVAVEGGAAVGCVALRPLEPPLVGELKRLYVAPAARGLGLGARLTEAALEAARAAGYERVRLDTLDSMDAALRLYERLGFREIAAYRYNPFESAHYLELTL